VISKIAIKKVAKFAINFSLFSHLKEKEMKAGPKE